MRMRWTYHVASMGEKRNAYKFLTGNPERKRLFVRRDCTWEDNIN
jgi:hypothetical protein